MTTTRTEAKMKGILSIKLLSDAAGIIGNACVQVNSNSEKIMRKYIV